MQFNVVCEYPRVVQYRLMRIERVLYEGTSEALRTWVSSDYTPETEQLYYTTLGKLAQANHRCLVRMNEIRERLQLPPHVDETTYPVKMPPDWEE